MRKKRGTEDLDSAMDVLEALEAREKMGRASRNEGGKTLIGRVEHFYDRLNVIAVRLKAELAVGDVIEIGGEEEAIRQKVTSMQINRRDVSKAANGDSVGIKVKHVVSAGSSVYRVG